MTFLHILWWELFHVEPFSVAVGWFAGVIVMSVWAGFLEGAP